MASAGGRRSRLVWFWVALAVAFVLGVASLAVGPPPRNPARLELLALDADGRFSSDVRLLPDSLDDAALRFPLILGIRNTGVRPALAVRLHLSIPARFTLSDSSGRLDRNASDDGPLARYTLQLSGGAIEPGALPAVPPGADRLWLETSAAPIACSLPPDGVPSFEPAPPYPAEQLAQAQLFYSFETDRSAGRQTGLLRLTFDPSLLPDPSDSADFELGPVVIEAPDVVRPIITQLQLEGVRDTDCGEPGRMAALRSVVWQADAGRFLVLITADVPRKHLFDLDGDGRVELEIWDADADGHFEARRTASFPIPRFLLPRETDTLRSEPR
jgi:hypothetical protein